MCGSSGQGTPSAWGTSVASFERNHVKQQELKDLGKGTTFGSYSSVEEGRPGAWLSVDQELEEVQEGGKTEMDPP